MNESCIKTLSPEFVRNTIGLCGNLGERRLSDLPKIIGTLEKMWSLEVSNPFQENNENWKNELASAEIWEV